MWIPITLAAASFQILRTARQHQLRDHLSTAAAGFVRYAYGAPLALAISWLLFGPLGRDLPTVPVRFWPTVTGAGVAQIVGTVALLGAFRIRDFAIGTVYSKSEVLIVAALGAFGVGRGLAGPGWLGAILVSVGVAALAADGSAAKLVQRAGDPAALLGLAAGAGFALAAIGIGSAARSLTGAPPFDRAVLTLTCVLAVQTLVNGAWFAVADRRALVAVARAWRPAVPVGVLSLLGSIGWAWAFTLESAAKVRTLGQVELVIAFTVAHVRLGERHRARELLASALVLVGVVVVTVAG